MRKARALTVEAIQRLETEKIVLEIKLKLKKKRYSLILSTPRTYLYGDMTSLHAPCLCTHGLGCSTCMQVHFIFLPKLMKH